MHYLKYQKHSNVYFHGELLSRDFIAKNKPHIAGVKGIKCIDRKEVIYKFYSNEQLLNILILGKEIVLLDLVVALQRKWSDMQHRKNSF